MQDFIDNRPLGPMINLSGPMTYEQPTRPRSAVPPGPNGMFLCLDPAPNFSSCLFQADGLSLLEKSQFHLC